MCEKFLLQTFALHIPKRYYTAFKRCRKSFVTRWTESRSCHCRLNLVVTKNDFSIFQTSDYQLAVCWSRSKKIVIWIYRNWSTSVVLVVITENLVHPVFRWFNNTSCWVVRWVNDQFRVRVKLQVCDSCTFLHHLQTWNALPIASFIKPDMAVVFCANSNYQVYKDK